MTDRELLQALYNDMQMMKADMQAMKADMQAMKADMQAMKAEIRAMKAEMQTMKADIETMKADIQTMKADIQALQNRVASIELTLESETNRNIKIVAEGHAILNRRLDEALKVESEKEMLLIRVNRLENEVRKIKEEVWKVQMA